jgi:phage-related protein
MYELDSNKVERTGRGARMTKTLSVSMNYQFIVTGSQEQVREIVSWVVLNCNSYVFWIRA